jgi:hypothetical protein
MPMVIFITVAQAHLEPKKIILKKKVSNLLLKHFGGYRESQKGC